MSNLLHMETDTVREIARRIRQSTDKIHWQSNDVYRSAQHIDWSGPSRDEFVREVDNILRKIDDQVDQGKNLANRLDREIDEWERTSAHIGVDLDQFTNVLKQLGAMIAAPAVAVAQILKSHPGELAQRPINDKKPENMQQLAKAVTSLYGTGTPIRVVKIGENEYLVLVTGTEGGDQSNNWNSAVWSDLGMESDYQKQLKTILMGLPAGAVVNMAGHSQGGIVCNNLAVDQDVSQHLSVHSVTTFGSPVSAEPKDGAIYKRYAVLGDPIPTLGYKDVQEVSETVQNPFRWGETGEVVKDVSQVVIPGKITNWTMNLEMVEGALWDLHLHSYDDEDSMLTKFKDIPFSVTQWEDGTCYKSGSATGKMPGLDDPKPPAGSGGW